MKNNYSRDLDKTCIYLNVFYNEKELYTVPADILTDARNRYFAGGGKTVKDKISFSVNGSRYSYMYRIDARGKLKWRALENGILSEEAVAEPAGYIIIYREQSGFIRKKMYFNHSHIWQKTEYFERNQSEPVISLMPWLNDDRAAIAVYDGETSFPQILYALPMSDSEYDFEQAAMLCQPSVSATVNNIKYYFGDEELEKQWETILSGEDEETSEENVTNAEIKQYFDISALDKDTDFRNLADTEDIFTGYSAAAVLPVSETIVKPDDNEAEEQPEDEEEEASFTEEIPQKRIAGGNTDYTVSADKIVNISAKEKGLYFGELTSDGKRSGSGRTQTLSGKTLYEGEYLDDKKNGFGVTFFKSGKIAYAGSYIDGKKNGFGIEFRAVDGGITVADFCDGERNFIFAKFDKNRSLVYAGSRYGEKSGGISINPENGEIFIAKSRNGEQQQKGTVISADGILLYSGDYKNGSMDGEGTLFNEDGSIKYKGEFRRNLYSGNGMLIYENGNVYTGEFLAGMPSGRGELKNSSGATIYTGSWKKGLYNGDGRLYNDDGSYSDGKFTNGQAKGKITVYDENGMINYSGTVLNNKPDGSGICYSNGVKVYDGQLSEGVRSGTGRLYQNGECVYMGTFENDIFSDFGISYENGREVYSGMWKNGKYSGAGLLKLENGISMAGSFSEGSPDGRINVIKDGILIKECIYKNGECEYMREYSKDGMSVIYDGNVKGDLRSGMGCTFTEYGEKLFEGIFKNGEPLKSMKVSLREMPELEYISKLKDTEYEKFRQSREFVVEQPMLSGVYSGQLKDGIPCGKGTILYSDHRYTGSFLNGIASGSGVIYCGDGTVISGVFSDKAVVGTEAVKFLNVTYNMVK